MPKAQSTASSTGWSKRYGRKGTTERPSYKPGEISNAPSQTTPTFTTYPYGEPCAQNRTLHIFDRTTRVLDYTVNGKRRQSHTSNALEHSTLGHDHAIILRKRNLGCRPRSQRILLLLPPFCRQRLVEIPRRHTAEDLLLRDRAGILVRIAGRGQRAPVAQVRLVALVADIADQIGPGYTVGRSDEPGMRDRAKRFSYVGGIRNITLGREEDGADPPGISGITVWCVGGVDVAGRRGGAYG